MNSWTRAFQSRSFVSDTRSRRELQFGFLSHAYFTTEWMLPLREYFACIGAEQTGHFKSPVAMCSLQLVFFRLAAIFCWTRSKVAVLTSGGWFGFSRDPTTI